MKHTMAHFLASMALAAALALPARVSADTDPGNANDDPPVVTERDQGAMRTKPDHVIRLEAAYGPPSQEGFGSAVFYDTLQATDDLAQAALAKYRYFVGGLWDRYGEEAWMGPWREVYARTPGVKADIVAELRAISDPDARLSVPMILDNIEGAEAARAALSAAYDVPTVTELRAFNLGDGEAMTGILIAGRRASSGEAAFLVFLLD